MKIAMSVIFGDRSFYAVLSEGKQMTLGQQNADITIPGLEKTISVLWENGAAAIKIAQGMQSKKIRVLPDQIVVLDNESRLVVHFTEAGVSAAAVELPDACTVHFGRSSQKSEEGNRNQLIFSLPFVSGHHFRLVRKDGTATVTDLGSKNGLYLNGKKVQEATLSEGDVLSVFSLRICYRGQRLELENVGNALKQRPILPMDSRKVAPLNPGKGVSGLHSRSPRLVANVSREVINLEQPPEAGATPQINWMSVLVTPMISVVLMIVLVVTLGMSPIMLIMSGVMTVISTVTAIFSYRKQKKNHEKLDALIEGKYTAYLETVQSRLEEARKRQLQSLVAANPAPEDCAKIARTQERSLWERGAHDEDFLHVRLGLGIVSAAMTAAYQQPQVVIRESKLEEKAKILAQNSRTIANAPILIDMAREKMLGIVGDRADALQLARNMTVSVTTAHSYDEVKVIVLAPQRELGYWEWARWLPHCTDDQRNQRYIFTSLDDAEGVLDELDGVLSHRRADSMDGRGMEASEQLPHYILIAAEKGILENHPVRKNLFSDVSGGCTTLFLYDRLTALPKECARILEVSQGQGQIYSKLNSEQKTNFRLDAFTVMQADRFARSLAPVFIRTETADASLTKSISFLDGYGVRHPGELNIAERWKNAQTYRSLAVPVAALPGGDTFSFDIHEKRHGVNGIVAGMPGSGKTEMVQSWLLSLAVNYSPQDVSFVLIDFKGTGMIAPFRKLPHLAGAISNLDTVIDRNLAAIRSEVHRREAIIDRYSDRNVKNVNDLNKNYAQGLVPERLPILLIVIDEFAEFKKNFPDFGAEIDSLTSKGRALGIFVVLMTQKPAGVVSPKSEDNIKFRWCLRVANYSASREMLGRPDAARISVPGRAFIKVGEDDVFEQVQSFWSGAPYYTDDAADDRTFTPISTVELSGKHCSCEDTAEKREKRSNESQIDAVVRYISEYCLSQGIPAAEKVWTPRLPERLCLQELVDAGFRNNQWPDNAVTAPVIGLVDDPENQRQYPMVMDLAKQGHTLIYGSPMSGKTTLLKTLIVSAALSRKPDAVAIYIMDFGGWNLNNLKNLPHVGGVANSDEPERLKKLILLLEELLQERKQRFSKIGVGNITAYREATGETIQDVLLVVDNFGPVLKMYPDFDQFFISLSGSGANYGIYLVASATASGTVPMKITQNIKHIIALQMVDKSDYTYLVGKTTGKLPAVTGRGYVKGNPPLEFQTALPAPGETDKAVNDHVTMLARQMRDSWQGDTPAPIPEMPGVISYGSVRVEGICMGLSTQKVRPVCFDWKKQHFLLISGTSQSGKSNLLQVIGRQMKQKLGGRLCVFDIQRNSCSGIKAEADAYLCTAAEIDAFIENLRPELQQRHAAKAADPNAAFPPITMIIDDYAQFHKAVSNDTIARLLAVVKIGAGLELYLIAAGDSYEVASLVNKGEAVSMSMARGKQAVMLGGCMNDHGAISVKASFSQKSASVRETEGICVNGPELVGFKAMHAIGEKE